ncbi:spermidine synthase [Sphingomonas canadensis]|uniref:Spermidine synthase n=1 Tax=Sphingomonas canadensis TaxID=1219257 RepID=A0ABW3HAX0_9SPHN|nr:fused MFS/spermidine synthase [Sphingomonas canadensis]MCW3838009.1 fused MFS/spermidine synthase [Sphingomonas canadensis]
MNETSGEAAAAGRGRHWLFVAAILAGSFLLFLVQPMVARMALPKLGGAPAVWNSAMLVYQALLLGGYAYAHWLGRVPPRMQAAVHLGVLAVAALWLPIGMMAMNLPADAEPALWVPWLFGASIGPLFFAIAAQAPLIQRWYSVATHGRDPYALYAASNIGSFGGLIAYPLLVEPNMALKAQSWLWTGGYVLVFLLVGACALMLPRRAQGEVHVRHTSPAPGWKRVLHWIVLSFVPSGLMLATTTFLTTDIVAVPLLWVVPLGLYLLSFSLAFRESALLDEILAKFTPVVLLLFGATLIAGHQDYAYFNALIGVVLLFLVSVACHSRMYQLRPAPDRLTGFYLAMSVGGALGGVFSGLIAPIVFDWTYEYPLLILAAGALVPQTFLLGALRRFWSGEGQALRIKILGVALVVAVIVAYGMADPKGLLGPRRDQLTFLAVAAIGLASIGQRWAFVVALAAALFVFGGRQSIQISLEGARTRSYFGVYTVADLSDQRRLAHGTTLHGVQLKGEQARQPTSYYLPRSGIGRAMTAAPGLYGPAARIAVVGLGTGTLACYARPGQHWTFYEIDPAVVRLSRDSGAFTFLPLCTPDARMVVGDARLRIAEAPASSLDLLALDAFSSDAVPMHLLTREAFAAYGRILAPNGLLMVHISNRFLDLEPVVAFAAQQGGWHARLLNYGPDRDAHGKPVNPGEREGTTSEWIALSRDPGVIGALTADPGAHWRALTARPGFPGWTDDYASIVAVLR